MVPYGNNALAPFSYVMPPKYIDSLQNVKKEKQIFLSESWSVQLDFTFWTSPVINYIFPVAWSELLNNCLGNLSRR